jgi:hypothetical protein
MQTIPALLPIDARFAQDDTEAELRAGFDAIAPSSAATRARPRCCGAPCTG